MRKDKGFGERSSLNKVLNRYRTNMDDVAAPFDEKTVKMTGPDFVVLHQKDEPLSEEQLDRIRKASEIPLAEYIRRAHNMPSPV